MTILHPSVETIGIILVPQPLSESALACSVNTLSYFTLFGTFYIMFQFPDWTSSLLKLGSDISSITHTQLSVCHLHHLHSKLGRRGFSSQWLTDFRLKCSTDSHLWISITSSAIMRPILPAPALVPPGMPGTVCSARLPPPANQEQAGNGCFIHCEE